jgi:hypothetical protein
VYKQLYKAVKIQTCEVKCYITVSHTELIVIGINVSKFATCTVTLHGKYLPKLTDITLEILHVVFRNDECNSRVIFTKLPRKAKAWGNMTKWQVIKKLTVSELHTSEGTVCQVKC